MTKEIKEAGSVVQDLISQKGVQAMITIMSIATIMIMLIFEIPIPEWLIVMVSGFVGLYFEIPGRSE